MKQYLLEKLSSINYEIAIHPESANRRLASKAREISRLLVSAIPKMYIKDFRKLNGLIELTIKDLPEGIRYPHKILKIQNSTASQFIKLLIDIEREIRL